MRYTDCFVAFIDVLGFAEIVRQSTTNSDLAYKLTSAVNFMADVPSGEKQSIQIDQHGNRFTKRWHIQVRAFSDSVVLFMPTETGSIGQFLFTVRFLHDRLLDLDMCVRGAITIGGMYWNDMWSNPRPRKLKNPSVIYDRTEFNDSPVTLGPGLIEAYKLETECAIYPRILISQAICDYVEKKNPKCFPLGPANPANLSLSKFFRMDNDGFYFLDLLHPNITRNDTEQIVRKSGPRPGFTVEWVRDGSTHQSVLIKVAKITEAYLGKANAPDKVKAKYRWLETYANSYKQNVTRAGVEHHIAAK